MSTVQRLLDIIQELAGENGGQIDSPVQALVLSILELVLPELRASGTVIRTSFPEYANDILTYLQTHIHEKVTMETLSQTFPPQRLPYLPGVLQRLPHFPYQLSDLLSDAHCQDLSSPGSYVHIRDRETAGLPRCVPLYPLL